MFSAGVEPVTNGSTPSGAGPAPAAATGDSAVGAGANGTDTPDTVVSGDASRWTAPLIVGATAGAGDGAARGSPSGCFSAAITAGGVGSTWGWISLCTGAGVAAAPTSPPATMARFIGGVVSAISDEVGKVSAGDAVGVETDDSGAGVGVLAA